MEIRVLDENFIINEVVDTFESCLWIERFFEHGEFEIYTSPTEKLLTALQNGYYLQNDESGKTMIIDTKRIVTNVTDGDKLIVTGKTLESILQRRVIWGQKTIQGSLQDGIETLLDENVINPTNTDRQISNFIFNPASDSEITSLTIEAQYFGDNLYDVIVDLCETNSIGFSVTLIDGDFVFRLETGTDRSSEQLDTPQVTFSPEFDNLLSSEYTESERDHKNTVMVAGEGDISDKEIVSVTDGGTGLGRIEGYSNSSGVSRLVDGTEIPLADYQEQLKQKGKEYLNKHETTKEFDSEVDTNTSFKYNVDFYMGDVLEVSNEYGISEKVRVTEFLISQSKKGVEAYPVFSKI